MTLATIGVRRWAQGLWQRTRDIGGLGLSTNWPMRLAVAAPIVGRQQAWQSALAMTLAPTGAPDGETDATARTGRAPTSSTARQARHRDGVTPAPIPAHRAHADAARRAHTARRLHTAQTSSRDALTATAHLRANTEDRRRVLRAYAGDAADASPSPARARRAGLLVEALRGAATRRASPPDDPATAHAAWTRRLAQRAARLFVDSPGSHASSVASAADEAGLHEARVATVLAQALGGGVTGDRVDAGMLLGATRRHEPARGGSPPDPSPPAASASTASTHASVGRARHGWTDEQALTGSDAVLRGGHPDADPLRPVGLATSDSAPAPEVPISAMPARSGAAGRIAPPSGTPSLPPLVPRAISQPPAFGLTGPALRQATRAEDPDLDLEEMARLSDRLRRLLRDEARRHGIALQ